MARPKKGERVGPNRHSGYTSWRGMIQSCYNPNAYAYSTIGARGIEVYQPWRISSWAFLDWLDANLGPRPHGYVLDRINNDGHYEPGNLRWATHSQDQNNRQNNKRVTWRGETRTLAEWSRITGVGSRVYKRITHGWTPLEAISIPLAKQGRSDPRGTHGNK
jgi:hypothetical protein